MYICSQNKAQRLFRKKDANELVCAALLCNTRVNSFDTR